MRRWGRWRKRWRYVGAYDERFMLCAASVRIGPVGETFWAVWDRRERSLRERTIPAVPLLRPQVELSGAHVRVRSRAVDVDLTMGEGEAIECACRAGDDAYTWTRKLCGVSAEGTIRIGDVSERFHGTAVDDQSAGYHDRRTSWLWSAGVGQARDGRRLAWNLVTGINDPDQNSERAIWVDGVPVEPGPVSFRGLDAVRFGDGSELTFESEAGRRRTEGVPLLIHSRYEAPFGSFAGRLEGGLELSAGLGVMERHDALW